jgi:hypothetical protein
LAVDLERPPDFELLVGMHTDLHHTDGSIQLELEEEVVDAAAPESAMGASNT